MAHWMQAVAKKIKSSGHKGIFKRAAARAGMSTPAFAAKHENDKGVLGKRARLAEVYERARH